MEGSKYSFNEPTFNGSTQVGDGNTQNINPQQQTLSQAAAEIQQLLNQLSQTYPTTTDTEKKVVATTAIQHIENNSKLRQRVISALKSGGIQALGQLLNHPAATFVIAALEDWQQS